MNKLKGIFYIINLCSIFILAWLEYKPGYAIKVRMGINIILYVVFCWVILVIIYNRKKIVRETKQPIVLLIVKVFLVNILLLSLLVANLNQVSLKSFEGIRNFGDSLYYTLITFSTVGYGDILPISASARILAIIIIFSNILLLVIFVNFFIMKSQKKADYLNNLIFSVYFTFASISAECEVLDKKYKDEEHNWGEWLDIAIHILQKNIDDNKDKVKEIKQKIDADIKGNQQKYSENEEWPDFSYRYIGEKDNLIIENFVKSANTVIQEISMLETNKINLIENENLDESIFFVLDELKSGFKVSSRQFRYGPQEGIDMLKAWHNDLKRNIVELSYANLNDVKFNGYKINTELNLALSKIDFNNKKETRWLLIKYIIKHFVSL